MMHWTVMWGKGLLGAESQLQRFWACRDTSAYLQQQDEVVHRLVAGVQIVARAQPVVRVEVHFLVDAGVTEQVEQNLLGHAARAEVFHLCRGQRSETVSLK